MNEAAIEGLDWKKSDGLLPVVVQDADSGTVLMVGYQDRAALHETVRRRRVVFFSRSSQRLWEKGETSGNHLEVVGVTTDCDADAVLIRARPAGPTCHTGEKACFTDSEPPLATLELLQGGDEILLAELRPQLAGEQQLGVRAFPQQVVAEALLAAGPDQQVDVPRRR
ncbi:MAG: phosphoribosyl-AMP cyclohydrolase, partial [Proteobacteria bacterium]|nr:phosphoribosyl-AMP cyclohydrolase [Pseudomonadota bacterium]